MNILSRIFLVATSNSEVHLKSLFSKILLVLGFILSILSGYSQQFNDTGTFSQYSVQNDSTKHWTKNGSFSLLLHQASFSNWVSGGQNSFSGSVNINHEYNYSKDKLYWDIKIIANYGMSKVGDTELQKTSDSFEFNSMMRKRTSTNWYHSLIVNVRSQFTRGYNLFSFPKKYISDFFSPGYVTVSPGYTFKKSQNDHFHISPITLETTFAKKELAPMYNIRNGKVWRHEFGLLANAYYKVNLMKNISFENIFSSHFDYFRRISNVDVNYQANLIMQVNKYISANFNFQIIFDDDTSKKAQIQQNMGFSINYFY